MDVRIDETREQRLPSPIDHVQAGGGLAVVTATIFPCWTIKFVRSVVLWPSNTLTLAIAKLSTGSAITMHGTAMEETIARNDRAVFRIKCSGKDQILISETT